MASESSDNHDLVRLASFFGGEEAINVVRALTQAGTTTDDVIANTANVRLNTARKVLYKLYDQAEERLAIQHARREDSRKCSETRPEPTPNNHSQKGNRAGGRMGIISDPGMVDCARTR